MNIISTFLELDKLYEATEIGHDEYISHDYGILKNTYDTYKLFKDRNRESGHIAELLDELKSKNIPFEQYIHKTDNGITIFHDKLN